MGPLAQCSRETQHGMHSWAGGLCPGFEAPRPYTELPNPLGVLPDMLSHPETEIEELWETGQPNGRGEIEPSTQREWYSDDRVTHRRRTIMITGPWEEV